MRTIPPAGRWVAEAIWELLNDPDGMEWRDRVGVVGRADGSAKASVRLLLTRGCVLKTRLDYVSATETIVRDRLIGDRALGLRCAVWHPEKQWAIMRRGDGWYPLTICPELRTLRQHDDLAVRMRLWGEMLRMAIRVFTAHGLGLDLNPANFGTSDGHSATYYIDDEFYPTLAERDLAGAIIARIPEEPCVEDPDWRSWGSKLAALLDLEWPSALDWERFCDELTEYPVTERFVKCREAVVLPFRQRLSTRADRKRAGRDARKAARFTCILADVHANLPALEATLDLARALGADSYLFLGDAVGYGPHPSECIARLAELENATCIRGNHDQAIAAGRLEQGMNRLARRCAEWTMRVIGHADIEWLGGLPIEHLADQWMAVHGAPRDPRKLLAYVYDLTYEDNLRYLQQIGVPLCFYGHTHVQLVHLEHASGPAKLKSPKLLDLTGRGPMLVNPGSVGQPRDGDPRAAFAMWDRVNKHVSFHRVAYDLTRTLRDLRSRDLPVELEERLRAGA